ncbi:MAG TPA: AbrB/MazE/SpoVT family DNA-binding domain-containing protein [Gammaproteobacteria bacterium]|nr:AbrB/MazE/SpoVT family DNA-binding domain-containing protein [Gammaproteobacteria bacterium]
MAKVTSKLQITIPKRIAEQYGIKPGDELEFVPRPGGIRLVPAGAWSGPKLSPEERQRLFRASMAYVDKRAQELGIEPKEDESERDWTREELYTRDYKPR